MGNKNSEITINNSLNRELKFKAEHLLQGHWADQLDPPNLIIVNGTGYCEARRSGSQITNPSGGTKGYVKYTIDDEHNTTVTINFENPAKGSNKASVEFNPDISAEMYSFDLEFNSTKSPLKIKCSVNAKMSVINS